MEVPKALSAVTKKRKLKNKTKVTISEPKNVRVGAQETTSPTEVTMEVKKPQITKPQQNVVAADMEERYPVLKDKELVEKFMKVPLTNNQKGRIRQTIKESLQGTSNILVPDVIHGKIQSYLKNNPEPTAAELRRIRILYNLLRTSLTNESNKEKPKKANTDKVKKKEKRIDGEEKGKDGANKDKVKGPKRYIVFVGNLPLDVDKEKIMNHFSEMNEQIKDIRIPKQADGKKTAIAFVELTNEPSYEFALSKHHSMMGNRRINVLYTSQKNGKITKGEAKSKTAKLIALQKSGKLVGSIPLAKKRSQRRLKMKKALAKMENST